MTGFGQAEDATPSGTYRVEIRGVNNRFFDLQIRLPKFVTNLEAKIKKEISSVVSRGSIIIIISCDREQEATKLTWDRGAVENYIGIFREIKKRYALAGDILLSDLLHFSDFVKSETVAFDEDIVWRHLKPVVRNALVTFQSSRETEGAFIVKDLKKILREINKAVRQIEKRAPTRLRTHASNLTSKIQKLIAEVPDPQRIATEIALLADRLDIAEECTRLRAHISKFGEDLKAEDPVGKRMNFLLQEMNREANTIGAKANDTEIAHLSVDLKENVEKIREQVQNLE